MTGQTTELDELNAVASGLPPAMVQLLINYARVLQITPPGANETDDFSPEDLAAITNNSMRRYDEEHPGEDWSALMPENPQGYK